MNFPTPTRSPPRQNGREQDELARADALGMHLAPLNSQLRRELHTGKEVQGVW